MNEELRKSVDLFAENEAAVQNGFFWERQTNDVVCALEYTVKGLNVDVERMKEAAKLIDSKAGIFSAFRGNSYRIMATQMALSDDMEAYFNHVKEVYDFIVAGKWFGSEYYIVQAMLIAQHTKGNLGEAEAIIQKAGTVYAGMKKNHPWLTNDADLGLASLLAISGRGEEAEKEMEECYKILKEAKVGSNDAIQTLSQILSLKEGNAEAKCEKVIALSKALKEKNKKFGSSFELSILGVLAFLDADSRTVAEEISEVDAYLKSKKGAFGFLGIGDQQVLMYSSILVMQQYCKDEMDDTADTLAVVIATQAAIWMMIMDEMFLDAMIISNIY